MCCWFFGFIRFLSGFLFLFYFYFNLLFIFPFSFFVKGKRLASSGGSHASVHRLVRSTCVLPECFLLFLFFSQRYRWSLLTICYNNSAARSVLQKIWQDLCCRKIKLQWDLYCKKYELQQDSCCKKTVTRPVFQKNINNLIYEVKISATGPVLRKFIATQHVLQW